MSDKTLFQKILDREIPAPLIYEDDLVAAFHDIAPQAPVHVLIVPKKPIPRVGEPKNSATIAPIRARVVAIFNPLKIKGRAAGRRSFTSVSP